MKTNSILLFFIFGFIFKTTLLPAQDLALEWTRHISGAGQELGTSLAIDNDDNVFLVGSFRDTIEINTVNGLERLISEGKEDMFIIKASPSGDIIWCKHIGGKASLGGESMNVDPYNVAFFSIATDASGNVYITGEFKDTVDFDPGTGKEIRHTVYYELDTQNPEMGGLIQDNYENTFLLKLNNDGDFQWVKTFSGKPNSAYAISIDNNDQSIFIAGRFQDTIDVNEGKGTDLLISNHIFDILQRPPYDAFIAKFDFDGKFIWAKQIGGNQRSNEAYGIHADEKGLIYITGQFSDMADFNSGNAKLRVLNPSLSLGPHIFVAKYDIKGNYIWSKAMGSMTLNRSTRGADITTDPSGNILLTGFYQGTGIFDPNNVNNTNAQITGVRGMNAGLSCFVAKLDANGSFIWAKGLNGNYVDQGLAIATDDEGSVYTTGYFGGTGDFNPNHNPPHNLEAPRQNVINTFISKLDSNGDYKWARSIYGGYSRGQDILVSPGRNVYVTGFFNDSADFNHQQGTAAQLKAKKNWDAYVVKLSCMEAASVVVADEVCGNEYELNGIVYDTSGDYKQRFQNVVGCDSIIILNLILNKIEKPSITVNELEQLSTTQPYTAYQWLLNGNIIQGATNRICDVSENGFYTVIVTNEKGCVDTSDVYEVNNVIGIGEMLQPGSSIKVYPNPAKDIISIHAPFKVDVTIRTIEGRMIRQTKDAVEIPVDKLADGFYILHITDANGTFLKTEKIIIAK